MAATASDSDAIRSSAANEARVSVWDLPLRLFHWLLVLSVAVAFLSSEEDSPLNQWHVMAGWVAGMLIVFRLVWGFVGGEHSRSTDFIRPARIGDHVTGLYRRRDVPELGHNPLGGIPVLVLLALLGATVWTGAFGGDVFEDVHELVAWTLLAFIGLHVAAVVVMSQLQRENLVRAMISGTKPAARHPAATDARRPGPIALLAMLLVLAVTTFAVVRYDPKAFTLRPAESFEQRSGAAAESPSRRAEEEEKD